MLTHYADEFTPASITEIVQFVSSRVSEETCKTFISKCAYLIADKNYEELDRQIALREKTIKGIKRSKLINYKEMQKGRPFDLPAPMVFRWNTIVKKVLSEIKEGMQNE